MMIQHLVGPCGFPAAAAAAAVAEGHHSHQQLSILSYNVLLPNSIDGWWNYKMFLPPLQDETLAWATWDYRRDLLRERIAAVDADVVCLQEVAPVSFEDDFSFMMSELGYDGSEMFKKGRFRPATFWKTVKVELASPPVHKDRALLTAFRHKHHDDDGERAQDSSSSSSNDDIWFVLNCHLQAGQERRRRVRQINEGVRGAMTMARKLKLRNPERNIPLVVCGDFNGGKECGAIRYLEDGFVDDKFREDGEPVTSSRKGLPLENPMMDVMAQLERPPPNTLVVRELISVMVEDGGEAYENPKLSSDIIDRLTRIYNRLATQQQHEGGSKVMSLKDVEEWLVAINGKLGRGSEYREAAKQMGWKGDDSKSFAELKDEIKLPAGGALSLKGFIAVYQDELRGGKFWGIAHDLAVLGEPLPDAGTFQSRYDRIYCSSAVCPTAVMDFPCSDPCPNSKEPSDHLPVGAALAIRKR